MGNSLEDLKEFPAKVKDEIGHSLYLVQKGDKPRNVKPLKGLSGVMEIKSDFDSNTFRAIYALKIDEFIYVLHCFQKKSKSGIKTAQKDINLIKQRLKEAKNLLKN
jgi:phage-related protein